MDDGVFTDFVDWYNNFARGKVFRIWEKQDDEKECICVLLKQVIPFGEDFLIGYSVYDDRYEDNCYPSISYCRLSEIDLEWVPSDIEE